MPAGRHVTTLDDNRLTYLIFQTQTEKLSLQFEILLFRISNELHVQIGQGACKRQQLHLGKVAQTTKWHTGAALKSCGTLRSLPFRRILLIFRPLGLVESTQ